MSLTLHIVSKQASAMGAAASFQCEESGVAIGRVDGNDWILPDAERFVSSRHAKISREAGAWYVTDVSTNGTFVNDPGFLIGNGHTVPLNDGDRLFLGDYEILVTITNATTTGAHTGSNTGAPFTNSSILDSPLIDPSIPGTDSNLDPMAAFMSDSNDPFGSQAPPAPQAPHITAAPASTESQDPMAMFDSPEDLVNDEPSSSAWLDDRGAQENHGSALQQSYTPPRASNNEIMDDWDKTHLPGMKQEPPQAASPAPPPRAPVTPPPEAFPEGSLDSIFDDLPSAPPAVSPTVTAAPVPPAQPPVQAPPPSPTGQYPQPATPPSPTGQYPQPTASPAPTGQYPQPTPPPSPTGQYPQPTGVFPAHEPTVQQPVMEVGAGSAEGLHRFLSAAGVDPNRLPPQAANAVFQLAGSVFREVVQGLKEVLQARDELKSELRIARTIIQSTENNPLKVSVSTDEALTKLLFPQEHGYMAPVKAIHEAIDDIKAHQLAMTAGLSAALSSIMEQFDPEELEKEFDKTLKHSPLASFRSKSKYWDMFQDYYKDLSGDSGSNVLALYGEDFAKAYQDQIDKLSKN